MHYRKIFILACVLCSAQLSAQVCITNTNVLDVNNQKVIPAQTVIIENTKITTIGAAKKVKLPQGATVINGTGKYLMPGLTDAHVHFFQSGGLYARPDAIDLRKYRPYENEIEWTHQNMEDLLRRYTAVGITTVIDVGSTVHFLKQRDSFKTKTYAPEVYMTGPLLTTWEPPVYKNLKEDEPFYEMKTDSDARHYVQQQLPYGPDFIKIWYIVPGGTEEVARKLLPLVQVAIDEAHKNNLKVAVHATERVTAQLAVESGCDFLVHNIDNEIVSTDFIQLLKKKGVVLCPTLVVGGNYSKVFGQRYWPSAMDYAVANPTIIGSLSDLRHLPDTAKINLYKKRFSKPLPAEIKEDSLLKVNLKRMVDGGVIIATGTDAGNIGTQHASSYFDELKAMQQSGMSLWQLLQSSTINGARALGKEKVWGSVEKGKEANLVLLNASPLDSLANWQKINAVINKGQVIHPAAGITETAEALVQQQVNAYNGHNLEAFLEPYADDVEVYNFPDKLIMKGKDEMQKRYVFITKTPDLHCEIQKRIVQGNTVIDHERVTMNNQVMSAVAVYTIEGGKIKKVYFIM